MTEEDETYFHMEETIRRRDNESQAMDSYIQNQTGRLLTDVKNGLEEEEYTLPVPEQVRKVGNGIDRVVGYMEKYWYLVPLTTARLQNISLTFYHHGVVIGVMLVIACILPVVSWICTLGRPYDQYVSMLGADPSNTSTWYSLCNSLPQTTTIQVGGKTYTNQQCWTAILEIDPTSYADVWAMLGYTLTDSQYVVINGEEFARHECYIKALELETKYPAVVWGHLGRSLISTKPSETVDVFGGPVSSSECFKRALQLDSTHGMTWLEYGNSLPYTARADRKYYFEEGMSRLDIMDIDSWVIIGRFLKDNEYITVGGEAVTKKHCFAKALEMDPSDPEIWNDLGRALFPRESMVVNGKKVSSQDCLIKYVQPA